MELKYHGVYSGEDFTRIMARKRLVKLTNATEIHHTFRYHDGLNTLGEKFCPSGDCQPGGIYFIEYSNIVHWLHYDARVGSMKYIRDVTLPPDSMVYNEGNKFKTNKLYLGPRRTISSVYNNDTGKFITDLVGIKEGRAIDGFCTYRTKPLSAKDAVAIAIGIGYYAFEFLYFYNTRLFRAADMKENKESKALLSACDRNNFATAAKKNPKHFLWLPQTRQVCRIVLQKDGLYLRHVKKQTKEKRLWAVTQNGHAIQYVPSDRRSFEICLAAARQNIDSLVWVKSAKMRHRVINALAAELNVSA